MVVSLLVILQPLRPKLSIKVVEMKANSEVCYNKNVWGLSLASIVMYVIHRTHNIKNKFFCQTNSWQEINRRKSMKTVTSKLALI